MGRKINFETSKALAERARNSIKVQHQDTFRYSFLAYGKIINSINKEGLALYNDLKLKEKLISQWIESHKKLGSFCDQYGFEKIIPP